MIRRVGAGLAAAAVVAMGVAATLGWQMRARSAALGGHAEHLGHIRRIEALGHRLNEQVLRSHAGLAHSYDPLVRTMRELRELDDSLAVPPSFVAAYDHSAVDDARAACDAVLADQERLVEAFKTDNAVLRNSLAYFPTAADEIAASLETSPGRELEAAALRALSSDVLRLTTGADATVIASVERHLEALRPGAASSVALRMLVRHVEVIAERRRAVDEELAATLALPSSVNARALERAYLAVYEEAEGDVLSRRDAMAASLFAALFAASSAIILALWASARELRRTSQELAEAIERQNRFVSMTSHEFRTPLSVIVSSSDLLDAYAERWTLDQRRKHTKKIERAARGMTDLLDGLLLIGRAEAGHRDFRPTAVSVDDLVSEVAEAQRARAKDGITVEVVPSGIEGKLELDPRLLRHVLDNLVSNAVKYSKPGGKVEITVAHRDATLRVVVRDHGIGIPKADLERLFSTFHRAKNVGVVSGTGLGLAIAKHAAEQQGGDIRVESEVDRGTTFELEVPAPPAAEGES